ncbi:MAG: hypothetical protein AB1716_05625 [Planctomycetota bacterium]
MQRNAVERTPCERRRPGPQTHGVVPGARRRSHRALLPGTLLAAVLWASAQSHAACILDQIGPDPSWTLPRLVYASQDFEPAFNSYDVGVVDNFTVPPPGYYLTDVSAVLGFWNGSGNPGTIQYYRVEFYQTPGQAGGNLTGTVQSLSIPAANATVIPWGGGANNKVKVTLDLTPYNITLSPGTQYLAVIPRMDFGGGLGQVGVSGSNWVGTPADYNAGQASPGGGFGWAGYRPIDPVDNAAYELCGYIVPEPAAFALFALGPLLRRRPS